MQDVLEVGVPLSLPCVAVAVGCWRKVQVDEACCGGLVGRVQAQVDGEEAFADKVVNTLVNPAAVDDRG